MTKRSKPASVAVVAYRGAQQAAVLGLTDLLQAASRIHTERHGGAGLDVESVGGSSLPVPGRPHAALILPPSLGEGPPPHVPKRLGAWLADRHDEGTVLCSVCVGAFLLADAGLLEGRPATTHWAYRDELKQRYPKLEVDTDRLLIDDGDIITAGGLMAWIDLGLHLVARLLAPSTMLATARMFLVDPGGREQRFYATFSPEFAHGDADILRVQRWLQRVAGDNVSVEDMAAKARLGRRTFLRRFQRATGLKTGDYLQHLRVGNARELLERGDHTQEEVAWAVGYADPGAFRRVFVKLMGLSPAEYRRRFQAVA
ncbi:MAG: GlxA family transcriptional regulator [Myxococcota bacterium]